ncbi:MAG: hypothetical protein A3E78_13495 [Alphaproteobacteria bacterium RIFCSPHIGHO2_12_FULL_63_12]|nr:MAG: hypothetical protein A3E78_13495 [Alphaproteobacteria bacterium RIFCSPHIGHO2_12_FULL_63_12]
MNNHFNKRGRNNHQRRRQGVNPNRALDSNGPDVRIRGTAQQIYDKYLALARDATSSGDRVKAENYLQHAEHYFRVLRAIQGPQASASDPSAGDGDFENDQPSFGGDRDMRQPSSQYDQGDRDEESSDAATAESSANGAAEHAAPEPQAQDQRQQGGEHEGRRRRRRPRRPREEGGTEEAAGAEDVEPVPAG